ncbi:hypothetical protein LSH36_222g00017 [Paralvinella palmiformis]|uniref:Uncharacterized protein n=1 Tax=Paralvinella palmiformis TaxID=53620 RepID=A0AAD9N6L3_9ANNE|nr:hypothetical protein LSH36_222g00017 [Paralvinella palmiformis]
MRLTVDDNHSDGKRSPEGCMTIGHWRTVSFIFFFICCFIHLVSFGTPYWYETTTDQEEYISFGLWAFCQTAFYSTDVKCERIHTGRPSQLSFEMRAFQTNMTLALIANVMTFVLYVVWFCFGRGKGTIAYLTPAMNAFGGLATVIAVSVFGGYFSTDASVLSLFQSSTPQLPGEHTTHAAIIAAKRYWNT